MEAPNGQLMLVVARVIPGHELSFNLTNTLVILRDGRSQTAAHHLHSRLRGLKINPSEHVGIEWGGTRIVVPVSPRRKSKPLRISERLGQMRRAILGGNGHPVPAPAGTKDLEESPMGHA